MTSILISIVQIVTWLIVLVIIVDVIVSYFLSPYHPIRALLDRIVNPLLNPIRKIMPTGLGFDLSPVVLILLVQMAEYLLINLVMAIR